MPWNSSIRLLHLYWGLGEVPLMSALGLMLRASQRGLKVSALVLGPIPPAVEAALGALCAQPSRAINLIVPQGSTLVPDFMPMPELLVVLAATNETAHCAQMRQLLQSYKGRAEIALAGDFAPEPWLREMADYATQVQDACPCQLR